MVGSSRDNVTMKARRRGFTTRDRDRSGIKKKIAKTRRRDDR